MSDPSRDNASWWRPRAGVAWVAACLLGCGAHAQVLKSFDQVEEIQGVRVEERLGERIPLDVVLTNSADEPVAVREYFDDGIPVILALVYYECPVVCSLVLDRMAATFDELDYVIGRDYNVVVVSFDPTENTSHALGKKTFYLAGYEHGMDADIAAGWGFHTGSATEVRRLADAIGFDYKRLPNGEYSHPVSFAILSPEGAVSRYFHGYDYPPNDVRLSLLTASDGKIAKSFGERLWHFCYRYDPDAGVYSLQAMQVMQVAGAVTVAGIAALITGLLIAERVRRGRRGSGSDARHPRTRGRAEPAVIGRTS